MVSGARVCCGGATAAGAAASAATPTAPEGRGEAGWEVLPAREPQEPATGGGFISCGAPATGGAPIAAKPIEAGESRGDGESRGEAALEVAREVGRDVA